MPVKVNEIFYSIQGESSFSGLPCVFVRLTGCNLRCSYCDTRYAYDEGRMMEIQEVFDQVGLFGCNLIEITGGEPLIQTETPRLVTHLLDNNYTVLLETNGSLNINLVDNRCVKIVDIKCPSSGESHNNDLKNLNRLSDNDELKFVIGDRVDFDYAKQILKIINPGHKILFSVIFGKLEPRVLAEWILKYKINARLQLQLHKIIWNPNQRGV